MDDQPQPRTRWRLPRVRVTVRALMGVVLVLGVVLGCYVRSVRIQQEAVAAIRRAGGSLAYDWQWGDRKPGMFIYTGKPRAPEWLAKIVPVDYVARVVMVDLVPRGGNRPDPTDETLAHVGRLGHLESLELSGTAITDAGLAHLKGLTGLRRLTIDRTLVSDAGLAHLEGMASLTSLNISGGRITDEGILALERAAPGSGSPVSKSGPTPTPCPARSPTWTSPGLSQSARPACCSSTGLRSWRIAARFRNSWRRSMRSATSRPPTS